MKDAVLLRLIGKYLRAGVEIDGNVEATTAGVPQGGVHSLHKQSFLQAPWLAEQGAISLKELWVNIHYPEGKASQHRLPR